MRDRTVGSTEPIPHRVFSPTLALLQFSATRSDCALHSFGPSALEIHLTLVFGCKTQVSLRHCTSPASPSTVAFQQAVGKLPAIRSCSPFPTSASLMDIRTDFPHTVFFGLKTKTHIVRLCVGITSYFRGHLRPVARASTGGLCTARAQPGGRCFVSQHA